jgi:hypothetical protein
MFSEETFPVSSPLHFMSMVYSNQANSTVRFGGRKLAYTADNNDSSSKANDTQWMVLLAGIISNKTPAWKDLVEGIAARLLVDDKVCRM